MTRHGKVRVLKKIITSLRGLALLGLEAPASTDVPANTPSLASAGSTESLRVDEILEEEPFVLCFQSYLNVYWERFVGCNLCPFVCPLFCFVHCTCSTQRALWIHSAYPPYLVLLAVLWQDPLEATPYKNPPVPAFGQDSDEEAFFWVMTLNKVLLVLSTGTR